VTRGLTTAPGRSPSLGPFAMTRFHGSVHRAVRPLTLFQIVSFAARSGGRSASARFIRAVCYQAVSTSAVARTRLDLAPQRALRLRRQSGFNSRRARSRLHALAQSRHDLKSARLKQEHDDVQARIGVDGRRWPLAERVHFVHMCGVVEPRNPDQVVALRASTQRERRRRGDGARSGDWLKRPRRS
jgi:hypothetical protein